MNWLPVLVNLRHGKGFHIYPRQPLLMPLDRGMQRFLQRPPWLPAQAGLGFGDVELEVVGFMRVNTAVLLPISTIGFGRVEVSSLMRVPKPPARMTAFMITPRSHLLDSHAA